MDKSPHDSRPKHSKLQDLLPTLTNEEIEEMYHTKIKLALDKSIISTYHIKNLEKDINILAAEMKARNMDMRSRSPSRKSKILPLGSSKENYKTLMDIEKEKRQRNGCAEANQVTYPVPMSEEPRSKSDSASVSTASTVHKEGEMTSHNAELRPLSVISKIFIEEKKKVTFKVLTHMKEVNSKLQPVQYYKPRKQKFELKQNQMNYYKPQEKSIHYMESKKHRITSEREDIGSDESDDEEYSAGSFKLVKTVYQNTTLEDDSDFALIDGSLETFRNQKKKQVNDANRDSTRNRDNDEKGKKEGEETSDI